MHASVSSHHCDCSCGLPVGNNQAHYCQHLSELPQHVCNIKFAAYRHTNDKAHSLGNQPSTRHGVCRLLRLPDLSYICRPNLHHRNILIHAHQCHLPCEFYCGPCHAPPGTCQERPHTNPAAHVPRNNMPLGTANDTVRIDSRTRNERA